jgi:SAM-dependent methyltransferase
MAYDRESGAVIGRGGVSWVHVDGAERIEVGWALRDRFQGHGYATEIGAAAVRFAFDEFDVDEVVAYTEPHNVRSRAVMSRLGMRYTHDFVHEGESFVMYVVGRADHTRRDIRTTYDAVARRYEARFLDELAHKPRDRALLEAFATNVDDPVIEVGCGPGQVGAFVRALGRRVVGIDLSDAMARLASARLDAALTGDMRALPLATESAGAVLAFYSVIHLPRAELPVAVREFARVVRPGGRVLFSAHEGDGEITRDEFLDVPVTFSATMFQLDELTDAVRDAGLDVVLAERRPPVPTEAQTMRLYVEATKPRARKDGRRGSTTAG